jgi:hypothetical protein
MQSPIFRQEVDSNYFFEVRKRALFPNLKKVDQPLVDPDYGHLAKFYF